MRYSRFPACQLLVQAHHVEWHSFVESPYRSFDERLLRRVLAPILKVGITVYGVQYTHCAHDCEKAEKGQRTN